MGWEKGMLLHAAAVAARNTVREVTEAPSEKRKPLM